ncbi:MAG: serine/threonine protein kinase [Deltaproteobacteria bacterium]|jgi:serine/threonine protein kinase|nr:serine/threonine protein kinase [Deltaproteobacteria bacterium]
MTVGSGSAPGLPCVYGAFELLERLGSGGHADVYAARRSGAAGFERRLVIKRPRTSQTPEEVQAFVAEAKLASLVQHPNVVEIYELGQVQSGEYFMALELAGTDLNRLLRCAARERTRLPTWLSLHIATQILEALAYAHELKDELGERRNLVHCDVAPDNVYVSERGVVKLGDFGVAVDDTRHFDPRQNGARGKLPYMAPELFSGDRPDPRADVFSLAVVLWECLTQRRLFAGPTPAETISRVCAAPRIPPSRYATDLPQGLDQVLLAALDADRQRRTANARTLQHQLLSLLAMMRARTTSEDVAVALRPLLATLSGARPGPLTPPPRVPSSDEGLTYSIVRPHHAVERIPMPGGPASVETHDVLKPSAAVEAPIPAPRGIGETHDLLPQRARDQEMPTPRWPVWIRRFDGELGPLAPLAATEILRSHPDGERVGLSLTTDGRRWLRYAELCRLLGEDRAELDPSLPVSALSGTLDARSLTSIVGELARRRATGRLILLRSDGPRLDRRELHLFEGALVRVTSNRSALKAYTDLAAGPATESTPLEEALHLCLDRQEPFERLAPNELMQRLRVARAKIQQKNLEETFGWPTAAYAFEATLNVTLGLPQPVAILRLLPGMVQQGRSTMMLLEALRPVMGLHLERAPNFEAEVLELRLPHSEAPRLLPLGQTATLEMAIRESSAERDEKPSLVLAYLLVELGLLRPKVTQTAPR